MGMFDVYILKGIVCPLCGTQLTDFQSKDGPCRLNTYVAGKRYKDLSHLRYVGVYDSCIHQLYRDHNVPIAPDMYVYRITRAVFVQVQVPILANGRVSSDPKKYNITYELRDVSQEHPCLWNQLTSQVIDEEIFNKDKFNKEVELHARRQKDEGTR